MMKPSLLVVLCGVIILPLVFLFYMGSRMVTQEQAYVNEKIQILLQNRLEDIRGRIKDFTTGISTELNNLKNIKFTTSWDIRDRVRGRRLIRQLFLLDKEGSLIHPPEEGQRTLAEEQFFRRTESIWLMGERFYKDWANVYNQIETSGWYPWYWGEGVNLIYWFLGENDLIVGIEINKIALMADIIGKLPDSPEDENRIQEGRVVLSDLSGKVIYQWGPYTPPVDQEPIIRIPVDFPLNSWSLAYFMDTSELDRVRGQSTFFNMILGAVVLIVLVGTMGVYIYRESLREAREAAKKVSFVNQVSHELKTPLTNIRMYAELLGSRLDGADEKTNSYLGVIVSESHRLSRLIHNVLSFARHERGEEKLRKRMIAADEIISEVIDQFERVFSRLKIKCEFIKGIDKKVNVDEDILKQILGNLFNNIEKYAPSGKIVKVTSSLEGPKLKVVVEDRGPGIPRGWQVKIFQPFSRISNKLSDGVTGTGLGLTISRRLARLHGGDLVLNPSKEGASFSIFLSVE